MKRILFFLAMCICQLAWTQTLEVRVIDVGAGLCTVIKLPNEKYIVYDAGTSYHDRGAQVEESVPEIIPDDADIELLVISHTDVDHIMGAAFILNTYNVKTMVMSGYPKKDANAEIAGIKEKNTVAYDNMMKAVKWEVNNGMELHNLFAENVYLDAPMEWTMGQTTITLLCGFGRPLPEWNLKEVSLALNAVSIVAKIEYKGKSVLFCGDAVGRMRGAAVDEIIATEMWLVNNYPDMLASDVIIAPHHGADNGSSTKFIQLVQPKYVIFSAGSEHGHPTKQAADRYSTYAGVEDKNFFRTDRGEGWNTSKTYKAATTGTKPVEWNGQAIKGCKDLPGDDDIRITIDSSGKLKVRYIRKDPDSE